MVKLTMINSQFLFYLLLFLAGFSFAMVIYLIWSFWRLSSHYRRLAAVKKGNLQVILDELLAGVAANKKETKLLKKQLADVRRKQQQRFSRVGLVKFNPFNETGGQQSFALALINNLSKGLVLTSFHSRTGTRIYAKIVREKLPKMGHVLSKEEKLAIKDALKEGEK